MWTTEEIKEEHSFTKELDRIKAMPWWRRDKYGWPIELTIGSPVGNFVRIILQNLRKLAGGAF